MPKEVELREGEEAAERFRGFTKRVMSVPKSEIDKRAAAKERAKRDRQKTKDAEQ